MHSGEWLTHSWRAPCCFEGFCMYTARTLQHPKTKLMLKSREARLKWFAGRVNVSVRGVGENIFAGPALLGKVLPASKVPSLLLKQGNMAWQGSPFDALECDISRRFRDTGTFTAKPPVSDVGKGVVLIMLLFLLNAFLDGKQVCLGIPFSTSGVPWSLTKWTSLNAS